MDDTTTDSTDAPGPSDNTKLAQDVLDGVHALATVGDAAAILALTTTRRPEGQSFYQ
jgi:hypothetical protein